MVGDFLALQVASGWVVGTARIWDRAAAGIDKYAVQAAKLGLKAGDGSESGRQIRLNGRVHGVQREIVRLRGRI
jgi:hypothetical protein